MARFRSLWWIGLAVLVLCASCSPDGGAGSSGFDVSEDFKIQRVLTTQRCTDDGQLTLCPADQMPTPEPGTSATPTPALPTPTQAVQPTSTPVPQPTFRVDTGVADGASIVCTRPTPDAPCTLTFTFIPSGFSDTDTFRLATRLVGPSTAWELNALPVAHRTGSATTFETEVLVSADDDPSTRRVQFAVIAFLDGSDPTPATFDELTQSGANAAFVTREFVLDVITTEPLPTATETPVAPPTATASTGIPGPTATATPTSAPALGPVITYFGIARADSLALAPSDYDDQGRPVFARAYGSGMSIIVEGRPGTDRIRVGQSAYDSNDQLADLQIILSRPLGDGSTQICDKALPMIGGVPATDPFVFSIDPETVAAINDLGCRVDDGRGDPVGRGPNDACTENQSGLFVTVDQTSTIQFCLPIAFAWSFPIGDTIVAARLRDVAGALGAPREIVVRVFGAATPTPTPNPAQLTPTTGPVATPSRRGFSTPTPGAPGPTSTATATPAPSATPTGTSGPLITYFGVAHADVSRITPSGVDDAQRPIFQTVAGQGLLLIVEAQPGFPPQALGESAYDQSGGLPDLQMIVSQPLGNGSMAVCDKRRPTIGGVPATAPFAFSDERVVIDAINDLGCRVDDGTGQPRARTEGDACTMDSSGLFSFVNPASTRQFCLPIDSAWNFPAGDTIVAVRIRDVTGQLSEPSEIVVRAFERLLPTATAIPTMPPSATPSRRPSVTEVPMTPSATGTPTATPTPSVTPTGPSEPLITFFGVAHADVSRIIPSGVDDLQRPVFESSAPQGLVLIIEARPGFPPRAVGESAYDDAGGLPDLQMIVSQPLGDGSAVVCDKRLPTIGGVPATDPFEFSDDTTVVAAINDLGCRVDDGTGQPIARTSADACTMDASAVFHFVNPASTRQFCLPIDSGWKFTPGDTIVAARIRDTTGRLSATSEIIVRVPFVDTPTPTPAATSTRSRRTSTPRTAFS